MGNPKGHLVHGLSKTPLYKVWCEMKQRCANPKCQSYKWYGNKGIKLCSEWLEFVSFYEWALAHGYKSNLTIERINVNGDYCPENCKWITNIEQQSNRSTTHYITHNGESHTLTEWSNIQGLPRTTLSNRIRMGWSIERALLEPSRKKGGSV